MTIKRTIGIFSSIIFILMLILTLLFTDVQLTAFNRAYYEKQYKKYQVPESIGITMPELMTSTDNLLNYIDNKRDNLDFTATIKGAQREFFSERDKLHMIDVKNLFVKGKLIRNIAFIYCVIYIAWFVLKAKNKTRNISRLALTAFVAGILPIILLIILMNMDFYKYFTIFHEIFFNNDLWQLDPAKDTLINMFPESFFSDIAFKIAYFYVAELLLMLVISISGFISSKRRLSSK